MSRISFGSQHPTRFSSGGKCRLTHQPGNPLAGNASSLITQFLLDAWTPISALMAAKHLLNLLRDLSIFSLALTGRAAAARHKSRFLRLRVHNT